MKVRKRLTRRESKEVTRTRLIEAAEKLFIRKGFDDASVDEISETAGYSRGAFYSNFEDKEQVFLAVIDRRRPNLAGALDAMFEEQSQAAERVAAVREWFSNQWRLKDFSALQMEFSRRAMRDRLVRKRLAEVWRQDLEAYAAFVTRVAAATERMPADPPEIVALLLLAVIQGLGCMAIDSDPEWEHACTQTARLAFERMLPPISNSPISNQW